MSTDRLDRTIQVLTAFSLLITPVVVAVIGYRATNSSTSKDYVSLAVSILNSKDSPKESRDWAVTVLNKLSPVPVPQSLKIQLGTGSVLVDKPVMVNVPVAIPCLDKSSYTKLHELLPPALHIDPKTMFEDQNVRAMAGHTIEIDAWAAGADSVLRTCTELPNAGKGPNGTTSSTLDRKAQR